MNYTVPVLADFKPITTYVIKQEEPKPEPKLYTIKEGDTLTSISKLYSVDLKRLWAANETLTNPDVITPSQSLRIPENDEVLNDRPMPATVESTPYTPKAPNPSGSFSSRSGKSTPGWYYAGQCTGYVASRRFVPDGWGNATDWKYHAQAEGWTVSSVPVDGAIGWTYGHVVYVESVGSGVVTISEQNYDYNGSIRTITVPVWQYTYLY